MMTLDIRVPEGRDQAGIATLKQGGTVVARGDAAASVARDLAARNGNASCDPMRSWGDACMGSYLLIALASVPEGCRAEYGQTLLAFEPQSGAALEAESFGRLGLALYAGASGRDGGLRGTQGGVRLPEHLMALIVERLKAGDDLALYVSPLLKPSWWQFWRSMPALQALSADPPRFAEAPLDEATLLAEAMRNALSRRRVPVATEDPDRWRNERDRSSGSSETFQGQGGTFGGGGASGSWSNDGARTAAGAGGASPPPGVDAAGRILAGAAGAVLAGAAIAHLAQEAGRDGGADGGSGAGGADDAGASASGDHSSGGTAY